MRHEGSFHLDDVRHINDDEALSSVLRLDKIPQASSLGNWLRRMGNDNQSFTAWQEVNKAEAKWTYKKSKGYMPMVGHAAEVGQIVAAVIPHRHERIWRLSSSVKSPYPVVVLFSHYALMPKGIRKRLSSTVIQRQ